MWKLTLNGKISRGLHDGLEEEMMLCIETQQTWVQFRSCPKASCRIFNIFSLWFYLVRMCVFNWEMFFIFLYDTMRGLKPWKFWKTGIQQERPSLCYSKMHCNICLQHCRLVLKINNWRHKSKGRKISSSCWE